MRVGGGGQRAGQLAERGLGGADAERTWNRAKDGMAGSSTCHHDTPTRLWTPTCRLSRAGASCHDTGIALVRD